MPEVPSLSSRDYVAASAISGPSAPIPLSHRPPSGLSAPEPRANAVAANTSLPLIPRHPVDLQSSTDYLVADRVPDDLGGEPQPASQPPTQPGVGDPNFSAYLPFLPVPPVSLPQPLYKDARMFDRASNFNVTGGTFIAGDVTYHDASSTWFMEKLLEKTIPGAEFDSSARYPPPRCHPGTRLAALERCLQFISSCDDVKKMRWVFGVAGVGKTAIMQSIAEYTELPVSLHASVFFSVNGRDDGTRTIITLSYQFAAKSNSYRQVIEHEINRDPSLLQSSMAKQFDKLIVAPFIHNARLKSSGRVLIIIDGLDECKEHRIQRDLLQLISDFCLTYPSSPLVWLIASRPEPHITSFFSRRSVIPSYEKEEIPIDSDEARADVERFLREKLTEIKEESDSLDSHWPEERDFWKLASAAGGLFAYAYTVVNYIGDSRIGSPVSQLSDVLRVIDKHPMTSLQREDHPMALLDALYGQILSNVPYKIMANTRKLLLVLASGWNVSENFLEVTGNFITLCNWLGMTADEAYAALNHLHSVLYVPPRDKAGGDNIRAFHKSFIDYVCDFSRSGLFPDARDEIIQLRRRCTFRILNEVPDGMELGGFAGVLQFGKLASRSATRDKISLTWPVEDAEGRTNNLMRLHMYDMTVSSILARFGRDPTFQSELCIRFLTIAFDGYSRQFPYNELHDLVFDPSRRDQLMMHGILKRMPLKAISVGPFRDICNSTRIKLLFRRSATAAATNSSDPWNPSCQHERQSKWEAGNSYGWITTFEGNPLGLKPPRGSICQPCFERLEHQLENWKDGSPDTALVMFTSARNCCVQVTLVDPGDGVSEWVYSFWHYISWEERETYGGAVYCTESLHTQMIKRAAAAERSDDNLEEYET